MAHQNIFLGVEAKAAEVRERAKLVSVTKYRLATSSLRAFFGWPKARESCRLEIAKFGKTLQMH